MGANILIIEDDMTCAGIFSQTLEAEGYSVFVSENGTDVEKEILKNNIDIVILDIIMPETNGYDILSSLQRSESFNSIPIIVVTGLQEPAEVKKALELGALDYIRKPCEPIELAARVGSAMRLKRKQDALNDLAKKDALTGLYNRWYFNRMIERYTSSKEKNNGVSLIMFDCDNFKMVNDRFGHSTGDEVLAAIANELIKSIKINDIACRFGGEEMCVILPNTQIVRAFEVAERVRRNIEKIPFSYDSISFNITVSCGVANIHQVREKTGRALTNAADEALYTAKNNGRNRSEFYRGAEGADMESEDQSEK